MNTDKIQKLAAHLVKFADAQSKTGKKGKTYTGKTYSQTAFAATDKDGIIKTLGRKWQKNIDNLAKLVDYLDARRPTENGIAYEFRLSITNDYLTKLLGASHQVRSNIIDKAEKIGLLVCTDNTYSVQQYGKAYIYNPATALIIRELHQTHKKQNTTAQAEYNTVDSAKFETINTTAKSVDYPLYFGAVHYTHGNITDAQALQAIYAAYPWLAQYQAKVAKLNKHLADYPLLQMQFTPTITRSKNGNISKIGIRCTSPFCLTHKDNGERERALNNMIGGIHYNHDIKSSIYRVNSFMRTGDWADNTVDFYATMPPANYNGTRDEYKAIAMYLYFNRSGASICAKISHNLRKCGKSDIPAAMRRELITWFDAAQQSMNSAIGGKIGAEIFLHESCIYIDLLEYLLDRGIFVAQCYDGFYANQPIADIIQDALPKLAARYRALVMGEGNNQPKQENNMKNEKTNEKNEKTNENNEKTMDDIAAMITSNEDTRPRTAWVDRAAQAEAAFDNLFEDGNLFAGLVVDTVEAKKKDTVEHVEHVEHVETVETVETVEHEQNETQNETQNPELQRALADVFAALGDDYE